MSSSTQFFPLLLGSDIFVVMAFKLTHIRRLMQFWQHIQTWCLPQRETGASIPNLFCNNKKPLFADASWACHDIAFALTAPLPHPHSFVGKGNGMPLIGREQSELNEGHFFLHEVWLCQQEEEGN